MKRGRALLTAAARPAFDRYNSLSLFSVPSGSAWLRSQILSGLQDR